MKNIYILPTNKPSRLIKSQDNDFVYLNTNAPNWFENNLKTIKQNIYITNDEEIKEERCWVINTMNKIESVPHSKWGKLIILTTDQDLIKDGVQAITDEFLQWFVKNPSCERVEIQDFPMTEKYNSKGEYIHRSYWIYKIIIPKQEQDKNKYSEEEVIAIVNRSRETGLTAEYLLLTEQFKKK
jgi:hypothetical protein